MSGALAAELAAPPSNPRSPRTDGARFVSQFAVCVLRAGVRADVDLFLYCRLRADTGRLAVGGRLDLAWGVRSRIGGARGYVPRRGPLGRDRAPSQNYEVERRREVLRLGTWIHDCA